MIKPIAEPTAKEMAECRVGSFANLHSWFGDVYAEIVAAPGYGWRMCQVVVWNKARTKRTLWDVWAMGNRKITGDTIRRIVDQPPPGAVVYRSSNP